MPRCQKWSSTVLSKHSPVSANLPFKQTKGPSLDHLEMTHTNSAHAFIALMLTTIAEDPALAAITRPLAKKLKLNYSMMLIMTKARDRFLAKTKTN